VVAAVARLGERVGTERRELLRRHDVGNRLCNASVGVDEVEVVDALRSLVAEVLEVLEASGPAHRV
jgi:hypothetical protein